MAWAAPLWIYLWMAGMAGGAYLAAFLAERFTGIEDKKLLRLATYMGVPLAVIGVLLLIVDLGSPLRFWHLFTQFNLNSPMSMGTWILLLWIIIAVVMIILMWVSNRRPDLASGSMQQLIRFLAPVNVIFSVLLIAYTGVVLSVSNQPLWASTVLIPALFVISAVSTGVALLVVAAIASNSIAGGKLVEMRMALNQLFGSNDYAVSNKIIERLAEADFIVIILELAVLIGYAIWLAASSMTGAGEALGLLTTGVLAAPFWVGVVLLALLIPLGLEYANRGKELTTKGVTGALVASSVCVILGGLVLRAVITIGGQL